MSLSSMKHLTNRPQFSMVNTLIDHRNDVITCSKLKWNHEPQASGFTAKFWTFYGVISMVYKSVDHGKLWSICFLQQHIFFYEKPKTKQPALRDMLLKTSLKNCMRSVRHCVLWLQRRQSSFLDWALPQVPQGQWQLTRCAIMLVLRIPI